MRFTSKLIISAVSLLAAFLFGSLLRVPTQGGPGIGGARQPLYYHDPMHPAYRSDKPGIAPDCGMQLEPVYAEDSTIPDRRDSPLSPEAVRISLVKQQLMGLRTVKAVRATGSHTVRVLGKVAADEARQHRVTALLEGVVKSVSSHFIGNLVNKDDLLATYFVSSPDLYSALQSYFVAMGTQSRGLAGNPEIIDATRYQMRLSEDLLRSYGVSDTQMREMARSRAVTRDIEFRSPAAGVVLARTIALGQRVDRGVELYRIADLSRIWVLADVFENDSTVLPRGTSARIRYRGLTLPARVADALPQFDSASRTLKVRLELNNPNLILRPDMFVDVEWDVTEPGEIIVPLDAVVDSGRRKTVFVKTGEGVFEPREVTAGVSYGDRVPIVKGLTEGESVVVSGLFLLDSESRLQLAAAGTLEEADAAARGNSDIVCGMRDPGKTAYHSQYKGEMFYFCSQSCKTDFDANPSRYPRKKLPETAKGSTS